MAQKRQQPNRKKKTEADVPFDDEFFATPTSEPEYGDIFASLLDFASEAEPVAFDSSPDFAPSAVQSPLSPPRFSSLQKGLLAGIVFVGAALTYTLLQRMETAPRPDVSPPPAAAPQYTPHQRAYTDSLIQPPLQSSPPGVTPAPTETSLPGPQPLSLQIADKLYLAADFESALDTYDKLYRRLPPAEDQQPLRDFLLLRMALCSKNSGNIQQTDTMFRTVSLSRLPLLRALARYHQSGTLIARERYLEAVTKAYQTIALIEVVDYDKKWVRAVQRQCYFLVAEALTRSLLSLRDADAELPPQLWRTHPDIDPFVDLDQPQLKVFLASGSDKLDDALLSPQIRPAADKGRWSVICNGASIEELLARFATNTHLNLQWVDNGQTLFDEEGARRRPVYLYLPDATVQQVLTVAAGSVGLLARMDQTGNVKIVDPSSYASLAEHTNLLAGESVSRWQRFLMTAEDDNRVPSGHFSLGLLHTVRERPNDAIAEYKLVANRFAKHALAPHALLHSGKLKVTLRDYAGAQQDLKQLVELYPDTELADRASLYLADATMKAGMYVEATGLYRKVYNLGLSRDSQIESALGAGRCFFETQQYDDAARWLNRFVTLADDQNGREFHVACLLLGKTYLALEKPQQAQPALKRAMKGDLSRQQYVETVATLVRTYVQQGLFLEALNLLEGTHAWQLSQQEMIELLLLRARILRSIGLVEKAIAILGEKAQFLSNPELKGKVALELTACYRDQREFEQARKVLSETLPVLEPGPLAQRIGRELATICLQVGQPIQAISVCSQLLEHTTDDSDKRQIRALLANAYRVQEDYDLAVSALLSSQMNSSNGVTPLTAGSIGQ
ncbi:MAG: tetratricopeptide repeat protein [Planctomycetota bacterium]|jgi:tetratricopeptide (TPR) repeat protein